ncbi:MAG: menaquinone biosynthesis protein [Acidobacteria bacterium]|nr:menaquinone biosynthesis protein [Acidobacteriota bacterium]
MIRISASSYSNTAPLIWSFLYGSGRGAAELIMDYAPSRSAELLAEDRVDAALVPVIVSQFLDDMRIVSGVCVGAKERVRSVCLVTGGHELEDVRSVALDTSSRTSVVLTKIIFREFLGFEPEWIDAEPDINAMLASSDAALIIGDPALSIAECGMRNADMSEPGAMTTGPGGDAAAVFRNPISAICNLKSFDLAELWLRHTGLGFIFAMWMTRRENVPLDLAAARDEGIANIDAIAANYAASTGLSPADMADYLRNNICYTPDESMLAGMELYFELAEKYGLIPNRRELEFLQS